jgi:hypothetical protein
VLRPTRSLRAHTLSVAGVMNRIGPTPMKTPKTTPESRVKQVVDDARTMLADFMEGKETENPTQLQLLLYTIKMGRLGGPEGICMLTKQAALDANGDGTIGPDEVELFDGMAERMIDTANNVLLNRGVVGALVLSVIFPLPLEALEADWEVWNKYETDREFHYRLLAFIAVHLGVGSSFVGVTTSALYCKPLSFELGSIPLLLHSCLTFRLRILVRQMQTSTFAFPHVRCSSPTFRRPCRQCL